VEPDYKAAFNILMDYWDHIPEEEKALVDQKLRLVMGDNEPTTADQFNTGVYLDRNGPLKDTSHKIGPAPLHKIQEALKRLKYEYDFGIPDKEEGLRIWKKDPIVLKALKEEFGKSA